MNLKTFLTTKDKDLEVQVVHQIKIENMISNMTLSGGIEKPHLFDVIRWEVKMNNYKPLVVVYVR